MNDLPARRRYFAEELEAVCGLRTPALVEAFAMVPREDFLPAGPWLVRSETDYLSGPPRQTPDADVRRLSHNIAVAIDPARLLFKRRALSPRHLPGSAGARGWAARAARRLRPRLLLRRDCALRLG